MISPTKTHIKSFLQSYWPLISMLVIVIMLRLPNFFEPYWYGDEGIYLTIGQAIRRGSKLYAEIIDHKTPIIYWLAAAAHTLHNFKAILLVASLSSVFVYYLLLKSWFKSNFTTFVLGMVFVLATCLPRYEGNIVNGELILIPFVLLAIFIFWKRFPHQIKTPSQLSSYFKSTSWIAPVAIGFLFSIAVLTKVPSIFDLITLGVFLAFFTPFFWSKKNINHSLLYSAQILGGFFFGILLSILIFASQSILDSYLDFGLFYNFRYMESWGSPFSHPLAIFLSSVSGRLLLAILALFIFRFSPTRKNLTLTFTLIWLVLTLFAATLSLRPYPHYFLQVMPPAILLIGFIYQGLKSEKIISSISLLVAILITSQLKPHPYPIFSYYQNFYNYINNKLDLNDYLITFDPITPDTYQTAAWIQQRVLPHERVYIHGNQPMVYALSDRSPASKYSVHFHIESLDAYDQVIQDINQNPPEYILDYYQDRSSFPALYTTLDIEYVFVEELNQAKIYHHIKL